jgi:hypothetical protein
LVVIVDLSSRLATREPLGAVPVDPSLEQREGALGSLRVRRVLRAQHKRGRAAFETVHIKVRSKARVKGEALAERRRVCDAVCVARAQREERRRSER